MIFKNPSNSIKPGYYLVNFGSAASRGNDCAICIPLKQYADIAKSRGLPNSNLCPYEVAPLLKHIVAVENDKIEITKYGVAINGKGWIFRKSLVSTKELKNKLLPLGYKYKLKYNEYFVLGDLSNSFDSRYFGVVSRKFILGKAKFLW